MTDSLTKPLPLTAYERWQRQEGVPIHHAYYVESLYTLDLGPWARKGGSGAYLNLGKQEEDDAYVVEIPPGGELIPEHHLFEALLFVLSGRGATSVWANGAERRTVEWQAGSLFSPPLNCWYQHFNASGSEPARLLAVTGQPKAFETYRSPEFIYGCDWTFRDRFGGEEDYFKDPGRRLMRLCWRTNFVPDVRSFPLEEEPERGPGFNMKFALAENSMVAHVSEFPIATYKKAHRHGPGAYVIILGGEGYSRLWFEGDAESMRVDWRDGSVLSPSDGMYHQHFNTGRGPARYLALRPGGHPEFGAARHQRHEDQRAVNQIEYQEEDPAIREEYEAELAKIGLTIQLNTEEYRLADTYARVARGELV
ncbi:MAG: Gentisate 1,2-dioxygenase [Chloroflexi bacterium]|nr:Gentisate 1,2-dioxygenase [Chloroflexota bacterium]